MSDDKENNDNSDKGNIVPFNSKSETVKGIMEAAQQKADEAINTRPPLWRVSFKNGEKGLIRANISVSDVIAFIDEDGRVAFIIPDKSSVKHIALVEEDSEIKEEDIPLVQKETD